MKEIDNEALLDSLEETFFAYFQCMKDRAYNEMLDFMAPLIFEVIPREILIRNMESMNEEEEELGVELLESWITDISPIYQEGGHYYAAVLYGFTLLMPRSAHDDLMEELGDPLFEIVPEETDEEDDGDEEMREVVFERTLYALRAVQANDWKFLENKPQAAQLVRLAIPNEVREALEEWLDDHEDDEDDEEQ
jgi:hypothetical protein